MQQTEDFGTIRDSRIQKEFAMIERRTELKTYEITQYQT